MSYEFLISLEPRAPAASTTPSMTMLTNVLVGGTRAIRDFVDVLRNFWLGGGVCRRIRREECQESVVWQMGVRQVEFMTSIVVPVKSLATSPSRARYNALNVFCRSTVLPLGDRGDDGCRTVESRWLPHRVARQEEAIV
ncbi:hypothetical protein RhiJN_23659 [Ceratobasidium sp. AG-Ba]|nr:hypothetical protein RhiJN_23659 [Ceratobasidium sp. AG-Ba]